MRECSEDLKRENQAIMTRNIPHHPVPIHELTSEVRVEQVHHFTESCLPSTMGLANRRKAQLIFELDKSTHGFPFEDRVLIWLAPHWRGEIEAFHKSDGRGMHDTFEEHQLSKFDEHYWRMLKDKLKSLSGPGKNVL